MNTRQEMCGELQGLASALVTTHISPDADAVGASCALALGLSRLGVQVTVYMADPIPAKLKLLAASVPVAHDVPEGAFDAVITVDVATRRRVGALFEQIFPLGGKTLNIDHHISNTIQGDCNYVVGDASSSSELVLGILEELRVPFDRPLANLLFAGIMDDTGCFRYGGTTVESFECASRLVAHGAVPSQVADGLYFSVPMKVQILKGLVLSALRFFFDGKVSMVTVTNEMLAKAGALAEDTDGMVDEARCIQGVVVAILMRELPDGWKFSVRSKDSSFDANVFASGFGGGGHRAAAGCTIKGSREQAEHAVLARLQEFFNGAA